MTDNGDVNNETGDGDVGPTSQELDVNGAIPNEEHQETPVNNTKPARSTTSSPSGRSGSPHSAKSDISRRRVDTDIVKEPIRSRSRSNSQRRRSRYRDSRSPATRKRSRSPSPKRAKRHSGSPAGSRSRSRSRNRNGRDERRRRSRSGSYRRNRSPPRYGRYGRNTERENPKPSRCIGVFGLSTRTRERDLRAEFEKYGPLDNVQLIHDHKTGRSRGFGFVYFAYLNDAEDARNAANGMIMDDRRIRVDFSLTERGSRESVGSRKRSRSTSPGRRRRSRSRSLRD